MTEGAMWTAGRGENSSEFEVSFHGEATAQIRVGDNGVSVLAFADSDENAHDRCAVSWDDLRPEAPVSDDDYADGPTFAVNEAESRPGKCVVDVAGDVARVQVFEANGAFSALVGSVHEPDVPFGMVKIPFENVPSGAPSGPKV